MFTKLRPDANAQFAARAAPGPAGARPSAAQAWWLALRPRTLPAAVGPVVVGVALAARDGAAWTLERTGLSLACLAGALLLQIASNLANDAFDSLHGADGPDRIGPARAAAQGWLSHRQLLGATALVIALALLDGGWLIAVGGWPIAAVGVGGAIAAVLYTGGPAPLGYLGLGDLLVFAFFGPCAVLGTAWVLGRAPDAAALCVATGAGAAVTAILVVNNLRDRVGDGRVGKQTLAVRFGAAFARGEHRLLLVVAALAAPAAVVVGGGHPTWLLSLLAVPQMVRTSRAVQASDGPALNPLLGATAQVGLLWALLLALGMVAEVLWLHGPGGDR